VSDQHPLSRPAPNPASSRTSPAARLGAAALDPHGSRGTGATAAERVLASELAGREDSCDALSMMVGSMLRMVQAGKGSHSRWKDA
jgi:hypothetical protein